MMTKYTPLARIIFKRAVVKTMLMVADGGGDNADEDKRTRQL